MSLSKESLKDTYYIKEIDFRTAMDMLIKNHYLHKQAPYSHAYGLFRKEDDELLGVVNYGVCASTTLLRGICGEGEKGNIYELNRLWVDDSVPKNGESYLVGNTLKMLDKEIVVSYADSGQGHIGYVYQASNFLYTGMSTPFKDWVVKGKEHLSTATYAYGMTVEELRKKYGEDNVYRKERSRKYRYIYFNAKGKRKKELLKKLRYKVLPYPKA